MICRYQFVSRRSSLSVVPACVPLKVEKVLRRRSDSPFVLYARARRSETPATGGIISRHDTFCVVFRFDTTRPYAPLHTKLTPNSNSKYLSLQLSQGRERGLKKGYVKPPRI